MSAHPFGRPPKVQLGRDRRNDELPGWVRLAAICAVLTILSIGLLVAGIDAWSGR